jgi:hypothetical protein
MMFKMLRDWWAGRNQQEANAAPRHDRRLAYAPFLVAALLLTASWVWAQWASSRRTPEIEFEQVSVGFHFLVSGALPWLLQWAGVLLLFLAVSPFVPTIDRRCVLHGATVPLILGSVWWTSLIVTYWSDDPFEAILSVMMLAAAEQFGGESLGQGLIYGVVGPMTTPLMLHGPVSMTGWASLWTGLSTAVVMGIWTAIAKIVRGLQCGGTLKGRQWAWCAFLVLLCQLPVIVRAVSKVLAAW